MAPLPPLKHFRTVSVRVRSKSGLLEKQVTRTIEPADKNYWKCNLTLILAAQYPASRGHRRSRRHAENSLPPDTRKVLGAHVIVESAAEIVHIGHAVLTFGRTMDYFRDTVFNYPTFAEAYKVAGLDGLNKL